MEKLLSRLRTYGTFCSMRMSTDGVLAVHVKHRITHEAALRYLVPIINYNPIKGNGYQRLDMEPFVYLSSGNFEKFFADGTCPEKLLYDKFLK